MNLLKVFEDIVWFILRGLTFLVVCGCYYLLFSPIHYYVGIASTISIALLMIDDAYPKLKQSALL